MKRIAILAVASALVLGACATTVPPVIAAASPADPVAWEPAQRAYVAWNGTRRGWMFLPSGLQYRRVGRARPAAVQPSGSDIVRVHYRGTLINGQEFDSSWARDEPAEFPLDRVIRGWTEGVALMHVGETFDFVIPADLAYGPRRMGDDIPANSTLLFRVEFLAVNPAE